MEISQLVNILLFVSLIIFFMFLFTWQNIKFIGDYTKQLKRQIDSHEKQIYELKYKNWNDKK